MKHLLRMLAQLAGVLLMLIGIVGVVWPADYISTGYHLLTPLALRVVAAVRICLGLVLFLAASNSRTPNTLRVFGVFILFNGVVTAFMGVGRARPILDWWTAQGTGIIRLPFCAAVAIGAFIIYSVTSKRPAA